MVYFGLTFLICLVLPLIIVIFWQKRPIIALILASLIACIGPGALAMIQTFQAMMIYGTGDPQLMAGGISNALSKSIISLIVFVPLLFFVQWVARTLRKRKVSRADIQLAFE